ncbi:cold-shock protein [Candidatus Omnitrophota bacterium]
MHTGKIKKLVSDRGFGFISDTDGREVFFHQSGLAEAKFDVLSEGQDVEFEVENSQKGPRAINIKIVQA